MRSRPYRWVVATTLAAVTALAATFAAFAGPAATPVTITIIEHQPPRVALMKRMLPLFQRAHPNIEVKLLEGPAPDSEFQTKLTLDLNAGRAPDVFALSFDPADIAVSGFLLDLTRRVQAWPAWKRAFYPRLRTGEFQQNGKIYTIPREATVQQLFYRKDVLRSKGISTAQPTSWRALVSRLAQARQKLGAPVAVFPAGRSWGGGTFWEAFVNLFLGTGSTLYDTTSKKWVVRSRGLTQVLGFYVDITKNGSLDTEPLLNPEPWVATKYEKFPKGELLVSGGGTWSWFFDWGPNGAGPIPNVFQKVGVWNYPKPSSGTYVVGGTGWRWGISAKTEHPDEAWELVKWLAGPTFIAQNAVTIGAVSPRKDVRRAPYSSYKVLINSEKQLPLARSFKAYPGVDKFAQAVGSVTESIITGNITSAGDAADALAEEATKLLGKNAVTEHRS
jgi:multiple sugar transport system substrate-binding protein